MIFTSQCHKLCSSLHQNQNVCKSFTTVRKDSAYQFLCTGTQLKCKRKIDHSAVCWHFQMISASQCDKSCILSDKNQNVCQSVTTVRTDPAYRFFTQSYTLKIFKCSRKLTTSLSADIFRWFLSYRVAIHSHHQAKIKTSAKVSRFPQQTQATGGILKSGRLGPIR